MDLPPDEHVLGWRGTCWRARGTSPSRSCDSAQGGKVTDGLATDAADAAMKSQRQLERVYRKAMSTLVPSRSRISGR